MAKANTILTLPERRDAEPVLMTEAELKAMPRSDQEELYRRSKASEHWYSEMGNLALASRGATSCEDIARACNFGEAKIAQVDAKGLESYIFMSMAQARGREMDYVE